MTIQFDHSKDNVFEACGLDKGEAIARFKELIEKSVKEGPDSIEDTFENRVVIWASSFSRLSHTHELSDFIPPILKTVYDAETLEENISSFSQFIEGASRFGSWDACLNVLLLVAYGVYGDLDGALAETKKALEEGGVL